MAGSAQKYRLNEKPRISANQLAEYTLASPSRRQAILRNAKYAPTFLVIRYNEARESVTGYLTDGTRPVARLHKDEVELKNKAALAPTDFKKNDLLMSAEAVASFAAHMSDPKQVPPKAFTSAFFCRPVGSLPKLPLSGVDVSVQLDLISQVPARGRFGGVVLQTSKAVASKSWREEHAACVATLVWMASDKFVKGFGDADRSLCFSVDLFARAIRQAPASYKTRAKDFDAACAEIYALWETIAPPADYEP
jgi:hypothetical protein